MQIMFKSLTCHPFRTKKYNSFHRIFLASLIVTMFGILLSGCSFLQPDFSAGREIDSETNLSSSEPQTVAIQNSPAPSSQTKASNGNTTTGAGKGTTPVTAINQQNGVAESEATTETEVVTETADTIGAGPLSDILGDNVPEVSSPGEDTVGTSRPQLSGLTPLEIVAAQDEVLRDIYDSTLPSVVLIRVSRSLGSLADRPNIPDIPGIPDDFFERSGGTGFVWDDEGHIVTNHHVVTQADRVTVVLPNRVEMEAEFLGSDPDSDLAVLKVSDPDGLLTPVTLGDSDQVYMGQLAVAMGNPFGQQFSITTGIISGIGRTIRSGHSPFSIPEVLQTDAPINPGNSGGPLLDRNGHVIGVNTQIISRTGVNSGIGFAVPINIAKQVIPSLMEGGEYQYSWLGISGTSILPDVADAMDLPRSTQGALVIEVVPDGPAANSGLLGSDEIFEMEGLELPVGGDVIVAIDGAPVETIDDVIAFLVGKTEPDQTVTMDIIRDGEQQQITVTLGTRPDLSNPAPEN